MKKLILLFTIVCTGQLYGMEPEQKMGAFGELPEEINNEILNMVFASGEGDTLSKTIDKIKVQSALLGIHYNNLANFTKLAHLLADKFDRTTREVAEKFNTPIAKEYVDLNDSLVDNVLKKNINEIIKLINMGADVNVTFNFLIKRSLLSWVDMDMKDIEGKPLHELSGEQLRIRNEEIKKILRDAGAHE